jgi:predicted nucleic acid-binding protein
MVIGLVKGGVFGLLQSLDDPLYQEAERAGHTCFSVTDVIVFLKEQRLIASVKPVLDHSVQHGFGIGGDTYEQTLRIEGEWSAP